MNIIEKAIIFAAKAHKNQTRKGTDIPYVSHPFAVGMLLQKAKCSEEVVAAGLLHDTLEDTNTTFEELSESLGIRVANLVQAASEVDKGLPWEARKLHTIQMLKDASLEEIQVSVGDKLHNLKSIRNDLNLHGETIWERFNRGKRDQHWYYTSILKALYSRKKAFKLISELEEEVKGVFGSTHFLSEQEIALLFSCAYLHINESVGQILETKGLIRFAEELVREADIKYRNQDDRIFVLLNDFQTRGIEFQSNSDGPIILAAFCLAIQNKMQWSNEELFKHFKKNLSKL